MLSVLLHLFPSRLAWIRRELEFLGLLLGLVLDLNPLATSLLVHGWSQQPSTTAPHRDCGALALTSRRAYRFAVGRYRRAYAREPCRPKDRIFILLTYRFPFLGYVATGLTSLRIFSTMPGGSTAAMRLLKTTS